MTKNTTLMPAERCIHEIGRPGTYHSCKRRAHVVATSPTTGHQLHFCRQHAEWANGKYGHEHVRPYVRGHYLYGVGS